MVVRPKDFKSSAYAVPPQERTNIIGLFLFFFFAGYVVGYQS